MSEIKDDPREVLGLLNSLGFVGITAIQLKAFMKGKVHRSLALYFLFLSILSISYLYLVITCCYYCFFHYYYRKINMYIYEINFLS